jgi:uncharacterized protein YpuA (DUF1002 family)
MLDVLNTIRKLTRQVENIKELNMTVEEKNRISKALIDLKEILQKTDSTITDFIKVTNDLNSKMQIIKNLNMSDKEKESLITSLEKLIEINDEI